MPPPTGGNRQIPIDPKRAGPAPAGSFPGGFRTPALGAARYVSTGRHPKPFTGADVARNWLGRLGIADFVEKARGGGR